MDQNFLDLLQLFAEHKVKFLIIGGYAVSFHAEPRYTKDIDFWIETSRANSKRVYAALDEFGAPLATMSPTDFSQAGVSYTAGLAPLRFDILTKISGGEFAVAYKKRQTIHINEIPVHYVSLENLIQIKQAAGRPQDKLDVTLLKRFKRRLEKTGKRKDSI
jgi:predicted nucleotidyltransferase